MIIAYCFIGKLPEYAVDTVHQARLFYYGPIYFIISDLESPYVKQLEAYHVTIVPYLSVIHSGFTECSTTYYSKFEIVPHLKDREKLFIYSFERFAVLYQTMIMYDLSNVFFLELDNLIYDNPLLWEEQFSVKDMAYMYDNVERCNSGICFIKNKEMLDTFVSHIIDFIGNSIKNITEMIALYEFWDKNRDRVQLLPTHWSDDSLVSQEFNRYHSVFDSAAMGIILGGMDPYHTGGVIKKGLHWPHSVINYTEYTYEWRKDNIGRNIPYVQYDDKWIRINNLHIHSKDVVSNLSVPRTIPIEKTMDARIQLLFLPELEPLPVMKCVFREASGGFQTKEVYTLDELQDGGIIFVDDAAGKYKEKRLLYDQIAERCPTSVFICWYWTDTSFRPFTYMIHTGEHFLYLEQKRQEISSYEYMKQPSFVPLRLRASDSPQQIGSYVRTNQRDYCFMGGGYRMDWVPSMFSGIYHRVIYDNYLSYAERKQIYLSSMFAFAFQSDENIRTGHLSQRVFEGLAYGCIVLCENPLASEITNGAIVHITSKEDLIEKMWFYKNNPDMIIQKQQQGYEWTKQYGTNRYSLQFFLDHIQTRFSITVQPIVSITIIGGLGNQLFQIATAYAYAKKNGGVLQLIRKRDNGNRPVYWDTFLKRMEPYLVETIPELEHWNEDLPTMYKEIGPLTLSGKHLGTYVQSSRYFREYAEDIKQLFAPILSTSMRTQYDYLLAHKDRVVIMHSRQTDYINASHIHGPLTHDYYRRAITRMNQLIVNPIYVLCGDDMSFWTKEPLPVSSAVFLMNETDIDTLALVQQFHHFIMSNSTFIWWCVWLADAKHVIVPSKWFGPAGPHLYDDIYEDSWEKI